MLRHFFSANGQCVLFATVVFLIIAPLNSVNAQSNKRPTNRLGVQASSDSEPEVRAAYLRSISGEKVKFDDFKTIFDWLTETSGKEKWRNIRWRHDLWDARIESAKTGKPIFIWAMNGDPLGCV
ncbi:hypothetical protein N9Y42_03640 [Mariniblastus sp.]|nr:hypothetical protein [Mariniblastus sp.]